MDFFTKVGNTLEVISKKCARSPAGWPVKKKKKKEKQKIEI